MDENIISKQDFKWKKIKTDIDELQSDLYPLENSEELVESRTSYEDLMNLAFKMHYIIKDVHTELKKTFDGK